MFINCLEPLSPDSQEQKKIEFMRFLTLAYLAFPTLRNKSSTDHMIKVNNSFDKPLHRYANNGKICPSQQQIWNQYLLCLTSNVITGQKIKNREPNIDEEHTSMLELITALNHPEQLSSDNLQKIQKVYQTRNSTNNSPSENCTLPLQQVFQVFAPNTKKGLVLQDASGKETNSTILHELIRTILEKKIHCDTFIHGNILPLQNIMMDTQAISAYTGQTMHSTTILSSTVSDGRGRLETDGVGKLTSKGRDADYRTKKSTNYEPLLVESSLAVIKWIKDFLSKEESGVRKIILQELNVKFLHILAQAIESNPNLDTIEISKISGACDIAISDVKLLEQAIKNSKIQSFTINFRNHKVTDNEGRTTPGDYIAQQLEKFAKDRNHALDYDNTPHGWQDREIQQHVVHGQEDAFSYNKGERYPQAQLEYNRLHPMGQYFTQSKIQSILQGGEVNQKQFFQENFSITQFIEMTIQLFLPDLQSYQELSQTLCYVLSHLRNHQDYKPAVEGSGLELYDALVQCFTDNSSLHSFTTRMNKPIINVREHCLDVFIKTISALQTHIHNKTGEISQDDISITVAMSKNPDIGNSNKDRIMKVMEESPSFKEAIIIYGDANVVRAFLSDMKKDEENPNILAEIYMLECLHTLYQKHNSPSTILNETVNSPNTLQPAI